MEFSTKELSDFPPQKAIPVTRISVPAADFSVFVSDNWAIARWTQIILQQRLVPEIQRVHA